MTVEAYPGVWRYVMVAVSMVELLWFSGIMYGWGALVYVLKDEGFLQDLCRVENSSSENAVQNDSVGVADCAMRDAQFNLYFTLISSIGVLLILVVGHTFTRFGTRTTRLIFITSFCVGCLFIAFADTDYPWLVCLGGTLMIGSGYVFIITSTQFNMLFPGHSSTIVGIMNGMKVSSSFMQQLVKIAYDNGISRRTSYFCLFGLTLLTYLSTIFLYPKDILKDKEKCKKELDISCNTAMDKSSLGNTTVNGVAFKDTGHCIKDSDCASCNSVDSNETETSDHDDGCNESTNVTNCDSNNTSSQVLNLSKTCKYLKHEANEPKGMPTKNKENKQCIQCITCGKDVEHTNRDGLSEKSTSSPTAFDNEGFVDDVSAGSATRVNEHNNNLSGVTSGINKTQKLDIDIDLSKGTNVNTQSTDVADGKPIMLAAEKSEPNESDSLQNQDVDGLKANMCGYLYLFNVLWFTVIRFRTNYFYGTINPFIEEVTDNDDKKVSYYTDILSYSMASGIITCIVVGVLYDWQRRFFTGIQDVKTRRVMSSVSPLISTCIVSVLLSSLVFVKDEAVLYPLTIIFTFFRSLLTTVGNTFLVDMFPASIYGTIYGTRFVIANVFSLIQYALYQWSLGYDGAGLHVNIFVLCLCLTTFIHPASILLTNRRGQRGETVTHL